MPTITTLETGREYTDEEVEGLDPTRQPVPLQPYHYNAPAPRPRVGLSRISGYGDRWCPYCQTPLDRSSRLKACPPCKVTRDETLERIRGGSPTTPRLPSANQRQNHRDVERLLDAIDEMSRIVGVASAQRYRNGGMKTENVDEMLFACKDVMVASDSLRRRLRSNDDA